MRKNGIEILAFIFLLVIGCMIIKFITINHIGSNHKNELSLLEWLLLISFAIFTFFIFYNYRQHKRKKYFEQQVSALRPYPFPSSFSEACEVFQKLNAYELFQELNKNNYRLAHNEKLLGMQQNVTFASSKKTNL
ncbi:hypothetical protein [Bartonella sp. B30(2025)]